MAQAWIDITDAQGTRHRHSLREGVTTVGGRRGDVALGETGGDQLHIWDRPPKLIFIGTGEAPRVNGVSVEERELRAGDLIEWRGAKLQFDGLAYAQLEEVELPPTPAPTPVAPAPPADPAWNRLRAGILVELGLADAAAAKRWQDAILRSEFEPESCARDLLASSAVPAGDPRILERATRLQRDLIMSPVQQGVRGSVRRAQRSASNWLAAIVTQILVLAVFVLLFGVALFVVRVRWEWSVDAYLDRLAATIRGE
jgi:hypothetical protein